MRILLTGINGFIGSNLLKEFEKQSLEVIALTTSEKSQVNIKNGRIIKKPFYETNWKEIGEIDAVYHNAGIVDMLLEDEEKIKYINFQAAINFFLDAINNGAKKIVYASSTAVYGNTKLPFKEGKNEEPINPYGLSKLLLDRKVTELSEEFKEITFIGLRYCNVYGPGEEIKSRRASPVFKIARGILKDNLKIYENGEQIRDYLYIDDAVRANILALQCNKSCIVNCGTGRTISFNGLVDMLNNYLRKNVKPKYVPHPKKEFFQENTRCDIKKAKEFLGFSPRISLEDGIKKYIKSGVLTKDFR